MARWSWLLGAVGLVAIAAAVVADAGKAGSAAGQTWPAFVLVVGLLLIGAVAAEDGLFAAAGRWLGSRTRPGWVVAWFLALVAVVTAVLNLDTAVAFLTPIAAHTRPSGPAPDRRPALVAACVLMSNSASLLLPGSNLTNLIVLGQLHLSGAAFARRMGLPWLVAVLATGLVIAAWTRIARLRRPTTEIAATVAEPAGHEARVGVGALAVAGAVAAMLTVGNPAPEVLGIGIAASAYALAHRRLEVAPVVDVVGAPVLVGLFGVAVGLGTIGRVWDGPVRALSHLDPWGTAAVAAVATVALNNLPAAALLSARTPAHPLALLIGLNLGPNLFVTGSLAWVLWHRSALAAGVRPDVRDAVRIGLVTAPISLAAATAALVLVGPHP